MKLLFDDQFAPITSAIGFVEADCATVLNSFLSWQEEGNRSFVKQFVSGPLRTVLPSLLPLTDIARLRYLFVPTGSPWTAYFDNGWRGPDPGGVTGYLAPERIGCRGLWMSAIPHTLRHTPAGGRGRYGSAQLGLYGPGGAPPDNAIRVIYAVNDGGPWEFGQFGEPLPFEETERYRARRIKDRFTLEMLRDYLQELGIRAFQEDYYLPAEDNTAVLLERTDFHLPKLKKYTLAEARAHY